MGIRYWKKDAVLIVTYRAFCVSCFVEAVQGEGYVS